VQSVGHNPSMAETSVSYADIQRVLVASHSLSDAAEAHGTLAGALCGAGTYHLEEWLGEILPDGRADAASAPWLRALFESTASALGDEQMGFQLLLPSDEDGLSQRTEALGEWCRGFLYGLGSGPVRDLQALGEEADEILRDITSITQVGIDPEDSDESNEEAYAELVEFVRIGVQLLFDRLEPVRTPPVPTEPASLH
jgi:uncharacterized protein YgfB (UPF0149 family)